MEPTTFQPVDQPPQPLKLNPSFLSQFNTSLIQLSDLTFEAGIIATLIIAIIYYLRGKKQSSAIQNDWSRKAIPYLESQFSMVSKLMQDSASSSFVYATGRLNTPSLILTIDCLERHDILKAVFNQFANTGHVLRDTASIECQVQGDCSIFALLPKNTTTLPYDVKAFTKKRPSHGGMYDVYSESSALCQAIQESKVIEELFTLDGVRLIDSLVYSDQSDTLLESTKEYQAFELKNRKTLRVRWSLREEGMCDDEMKIILEGFLRVLDVIAEVKLSDKSKESFKQSRIEYGVKLSEKTAKEKQEELAAKKVSDKKIKDKEVSLLSKEAQKNYQKKEDKKLERKELSKQKKKGKMMMA